MSPHHSLKDLPFPCISFLCPLMCLSAIKKQSNINKRLMNIKSISRDSLSSVFMFIVAAGLLDYFLSISSEVAAPASFLWYQSFLQVKLPITFWQAIRMVSSCLLTARDLHLLIHWLLQWLSFHRY